MTWHDRATGWTQPVSPAGWPYCFTRQLVAFRASAGHWGGGAPLAIFVGCHRTTTSIAGSQRTILLRGEQSQGPPGTSDWGLRAGRPAAGGAHPAPTRPHPLLHAAFQAAGQPQNGH